MNALFSRTDSVFRLEAEGNAAVAKDGQIVYNRAFGMADAPAAWSYVGHGLPLVVDDQDPDGHSHPAAL
jgi:hypothetical protein